MQITITQIYGDRYGQVDVADRKRALAAAEAGMTGLARVWIDAGDAANRALTAGWATPGRARCYISAE